jgi:hypothetical protein
MSKKIIEESAFIGKRNKGVAKPEQDWLPFRMS